MKYTKLIAALLLAATLTTGCQPKDETPAAQKLEQAKENTQAAAQDFKDYSYAKKAEYVAAMRAELAEINKQIDELGAKIAKGTDQAKVAAQPKLDALHAQADDVKAQLDKAGEATESTWESFKAGTAKAFDNVKQSANDARQWVADKIAP